MLDKLFQVFNKTLTIDLNPITDDEWMGWHGALGWPNGDRPLYAENTDFVLIIGSENGELHYQGPNPKNDEMEFGEARMVFNTEGLSAQDIKDGLQDLVNVLLAGNNSLSS